MSAHELNVSAHELNVRVGDDIPPWEMERVDPARMKTMAAILRDP